MGHHEAFLDLIMAMIHRSQEPVEHCFRWLDKFVTEVVVDNEIR